MEGWLGTSDYLLAGEPDLKVLDLEALDLELHLVKVEVEEALGHSGSPDLVLAVVGVEVDLVLAVVGVGVDLALGWS